MYISILNNFQNCTIFEWYFNNKDFVLGIVNLILLMFLVISAFLQLDEQWDDNNLLGLFKKDICLKDAIIIVSVLLIGMLLNAAGMELKLN